MQGFKEVTKIEFYNIINDLDICVKSDLKEYPEKMMVTRFTYRSGDLFGILEHNYNLESDNYGMQKYFIKEV